MAMPRVPAALLITVAVVVAAGHCIGWEYGADDVRFVRWYTATGADGGLAVRWDEIARDFIAPWGGNPHGTFYRPLVSLSLGLDFQLFGLRAGVTAGINLVVHLLSALAVYALALRVLPARRSALPAALLFALTPLAHENIAWAVGRCGLTTLFGLSSGLLAVRAWAAGRRGLAMHLPASACVVANLMTMESAVAWVMFPPVCLWLYRAFHPDSERVAARHVLPYLGLGAAYLVFRQVAFGEIAGGRAGDIWGGGPTALLAAPFELLYETLVPRDATWLPKGSGSSLYRALCLFPLVLGLAAPLYIKDPRSRAYRHALLLLLGFWLLTRLPSLMVLRLGTDLEGSRTAYYSYAPLALLTGLLAATVRYAHWASLLLAVTFGWNLHHRISERVAWATLGREARQLVWDEARNRASIGRPRPMALLNELDGVGGAPVCHGGEMLYLLSPPFLPERVAAVDVGGFARIGEPWAGAWVVQSLGGLVRVPEPGSSRGRARLDHPDVSGLVQPRPDGGLHPRLAAGTQGLPELELPDGWRQDPVQAGAHAVVALTAGATCLVVPWEGAGSWPATARTALAEWARLGGSGACFACFVETRGDPAKPETARARSPVLVGRIP